MMEVTAGQTLKILLGAAGVYKGKVSWIKQSTTTHVPDADIFVTNGATPVALIPDPTAGFWSQLKAFWLQVTAGATVKIRSGDGVDDADLAWTLDANDILTYTDAEGWVVFTGAGAIKGSGTGGGGSLTVEEVDGAPSIASVTKLKFAQADGLTVTDEGGGVVRINDTGAGGGLSSTDLEFLAWVL
jgi:hypothetical protein